MAFNAMGKLFDEFNGRVFNNEAEVSQFFVLPLLQNYLGYSLQEIIPEKHYPATSLSSGVSFKKGGSKKLLHRPDFVVCLYGNTDNPLFIIDCKGPREKLDNHFGQIKSYANSVGKNFLMMSNGEEVKVFDVNNLVFHSTGMADLQVKISHLVTLLGRYNQSIKSNIEILKEFDFHGSVVQNQEEEINRHIARNKVLLADFNAYLHKMMSQLADWHLPGPGVAAIEGLGLRKIDPRHLLSYRLHLTDETARGQNKAIKFSEVEREYNVRVKIFIGETGTGKTTLLKYLAYQNAERCIAFEDAKIPIYIPLREIGHNNSLEQCILSVLNRSGYPCNSFYNLPGRNELVFYFDALDEVPEMLREETVVSIANISQVYECYITSRPNYVPRVSPSVVFAIQPISDRQMEETAKMYLGIGHYTFRHQVSLNHLQRESGNILLLLFLLSLFKQSNQLPGSVSKIIREITAKIKSWQERKPKEKNSPNWAALSALLSTIAFSIFESGKAEIGMAPAEYIIASSLSKLEKERKVPTGLPCDVVIEALKTTGLLIGNKDSLYFWHRLFLHHFAAIGLKARYEEDARIIGRLKHDSKWNIVFVNLCSLLPDITSVVNCLADNPLLAGLCLVENSRCDGETSSKVVDALISLAGSPVPSIRKDAAECMQKINNSQTYHFFENALINGHYANIKMIALVAVAQTGTVEAKNLVYQHLHWHDSPPLVGPSAQAHLVQALSYFGEEDYLQIITNWRGAKDHQTDEACSKIFIGLHAEGKITAELKKQLQDFYVELYMLDPAPAYKLDPLGQVLCRLQDEEFVLKIIGLWLQNEEFSAMRSVQEIVSNCTSINAVLYTRDEILKRDINNHTLDILMEAIDESVCDVPKEVFFDLIKHPVKNVAAIALGGLKRFKYEDIKEVILFHINGDDPQLQSWAFKVAMDKGEIIRMINTNQLPAILYVPAGHTILEAIRLYHLAGAHAIMNRMFNGISEGQMYFKEYPFAFDLARTAFHIGNTDMHRKIVGWFFDGERFINDEKYCLANLMKSLKYFEKKIAVNIAQHYYKSFLPPADEEFSYETTVFIETSEELGDSTLKERIKCIVDFYIDKCRQNKNARHELERPMRALSELCSPSDEDWVLERLGDLNFEGNIPGINNPFELTQLRRAIEGLARIGSAKALPYIKNIARQRNHNNFVVDTCQAAYLEICNRENIKPAADGVMS